MEWSFAWDVAIVVVDECMMIPALGGVLEGHILLPPFSLMNDYYLCIHIEVISSRLSVLIL